MAEKTCVACDGTGTVRVADGATMDGSVVNEHAEVCATCGGSGRVPNPRWTHESCDQCVYLDTVELNQKYDIYRCDGGSLGPSLIARYGDEPGCYASVPTKLLAQRVAEGVLCAGTHPWGASPELLPYERAMIIGLLGGYRA